MSAKKGSAILLKVGNGGSPRVFSIVAGMRTTPMSVNGEAVNVASNDNYSLSLESSGEVVPL